MKKYIIFLLLALCGISKMSAQNNLYLIFDENEPDVIKNVYKYVGNQLNNPRMKQCGVFKIGTDSYCFSYPFFYGIDLDLAIKQGTPVQTMSRAQATTLYPNAMNATQLDAAMQVHIDYDYTHDLVNNRDPSTSATVSYFTGFTNIYVIEYLPNNQAKVVKVEITSGFD